MAKLIVNTGGMFSGKTTELLRQGERHLLAKQEVLFVKPDIDNRWIKDGIMTHKGHQVKAVSCPVKICIRFDWFVCLRKINVQVVLIDEVQFFDKAIVRGILSLVESGVTVYVSGLDMDYEGKPFETTRELMSVADEVHKFHAVCEKCGADAVYSAKKSQSNKRIEIGDKDLYLPLCRACYLKGE